MLNIRNIRKSYVKDVFARLGLICLVMLLAMIIVVSYAVFYGGLVYFGVKIAHYAWYGPFNGP
jgi:hypothetical protein